MTESELRLQIQKINAPDANIMDAAKKRQVQLAKPPGSLGALEDYAIRMAGITGQLCPEPNRCRILVLAADNGVVAEGISSAPQSVTASQCINMTRRKTGMSSLAHYFGDEVVVADVGTVVDLPAPIMNRKIRYGTGNIAVEPAMTRQQAIDAIAVGMELARQAKDDAVDILGIGEMGIGNTTTSAAVLAALTGRAVEQVTGRGGGLTEESFLHKKEVIANALLLHQPDAADPIDVLCKVGGLDIAAMCGAFLGCAHYHIPAVVDGFISIVAALCAFRLCESVRGYLFLSHASYELGYRVATEELELAPCLLLGMRLGEGSGCPLMFRILQAACAAHRDMATFAEAAINDDYLTPIRQCSAFEVTP